MVESEFDVSNMKVQAAGGVMVWRIYYWHTLGHGCAPDKSAATV